MKFTSPVIAGASGHVGGSVYSRNRYGQYIRTRAVPVNPDSQDQQDVRLLFANAVVAWGGLTAAQRAAWGVYGENVPTVDSLGNSINLAGQSWYIGSRTARLRVSGLSAIADAPTTFDRGSFSMPALTIDTANDEVDVAFDNGELPYNADDSALIVYAGMPVNPSVNFYGGPYRYAGAVIGDTTTPPTSPVAIPLPWAVASGQRIHFRLRAVFDDGRYTAPFQDVAVAS